jgi:hypothetical protein
MTILSYMTVVCLGFLSTSFQNDNPRKRSPSILLQHHNICSAIPLYVKPWKSKDNKIWMTILSYLTVVCLGIESSFQNDNQRKTIPSIILQHWNIFSALPLYVYHENPKTTKYGWQSCPIWQWSAWVFKVVLKMIIHVKKSFNFTPTL